METQRQFYDKFITYSQEELFNIILFPNNFQANAVKTAMQIVTDKKWEDQLN